MDIEIKNVPVAIAVLRHGDEFLLATRHDHQHQGGKLEFVGGKIEQNETPEFALIREVSEELGMDIANNDMKEMGQVYYDYGDIMVVLHVYQVELIHSQYIDFKEKKFGLNNQALSWLDKSVLVKSKNKFPKANRRILSWIKNEI